ncbi:hypothetical protein HY251_14075, partial [bacterium]|nr:hypothetical protein [bacterium]
MHFCLTGSAPLDGLSADERARKLEAGIGSPEGTSPPIASVLVSALRTRPEERPATVAAFGEALEVARARLRATMRRGPEEAPFPGPPPSSGAFGVVRPKLLWPGRLKRAAGLVALAGVAVVGAFGTNVLLERARRSRALGLLTAAEGKLPKEEAAAASRALEIVPGLEEAYAFRALARAQAGDLDGAENDVASAPGVKSAAARARAWILLRRGHDVDALSLIEKTPFKEDHDRLAFAAGRSDLVANRSGLRFLLATRGELLPSQEAMDPSPRLAGEVALRRAIFRGAAGSAFEPLSRAIDEAPGTPDAHEALLL